MSPRLPLQRFPLVHTRSLEELLEIQNRLNESNTHARVVDRRVPFEWRANGLNVGCLGITAGEYKAGLRGGLEMMLERYSFSIPISGRGAGKQHRQSATLRPGRSAVMGSLLMPAEVTLASGYRGVQVTVPGSALESALDVLTGVTQRAPLRFDLEVDLERGRAASAVRLLQFIIAEAEQEHSCLSSPLVAARLAESFIYAVLTGFSHNHSRLLEAPAKTIEPACLRRAEEYLAANAQRAITIADLAKAADVSAHALFAAFRAHRGCSPMEFLRARRFDWARARLLATPAANVTEIALSCGFEHLGRFSTGYRKRFGESPRETLKRARER
ncbi:MAG TPA: AraC family transcriptional regulator [Polyangiaceae bacterium]|nr:AraC family transcriptional regulator [Polyangiaceae bacterium]